MNLTVPYGPRDEIALLAGDAAFVGVDERGPVHRLPPGYVAGARNCRFRRGRAETRGGITPLPWMRDNGLTPIPDPFGAMVYNDPDQGGQWFLIANEAGVWKTRPNAPATPVALPAGVVLTRGTYRKFIQANRQIVLLRGLGTPSLICERLDLGFVTAPSRNTWPVTLNHATNRVELVQHTMAVGDPVRFTGTLPVALTVEQTYYVQSAPDADTFLISENPFGDPVTWNVGDTDDDLTPATVEVLDGATDLPPAEDGIFTGNRLWLITGREELTLSDLGDVLRYQPVLNQFRINTGDPYALRTLAAFNEDTMIFFKEGRILKALGIDNPATARGPLQVTDAYGAASRSTAGQGTDLWFLNSELRVTSLRITELNKEQGTNAALSDPLVQTFGRINKLYADRVRLTLHDGFLLVALPLDSAQIVSETNQVKSAQVFTLTGGVSTTLAVTALATGRKYQYRQGASGGSLVNGTETLRGDADFTAQGTSVTLRGYDGLADGQYPVTDTVKEILAEGVNTGVAAFDFQAQAVDPDTGTRGAWAGVDEAAGVVSVVDWLKFTHAGQPALGFMGADGFLHLWDDGFEDGKLQATTPYVDVLVDRPVDFLPGATVQVNGGTIVPANFGAAENTPVAWGALTLSGARVNLALGYTDAAVGWTAPNTTAEAIDYGVRFISTNSQTPAVLIDSTAKENGYQDWALIDSHGASEIVSVPITTWLRTRGYRAQLGLHGQRATSAALQLASWRPSYTVRSLTPGQGDTQEQTEAPVTRDPLKYFEHGQADWDPSNVNDDYHAPGREDYSFAEAGPGILLGAEGINFDAHQEGVHRMELNEHGQWLQLELENTTGRVELVSAALETGQGESLSGSSLN